MMKLLKTGFALALFLAAGTGRGGELPLVGARRLESGTIIPSYRRLAGKTGFRWAQGRPYAGGGWLPGTWVPAGAPPANRVWAAGRFHRGRWLPGRWVEPGPGQSWIPGHYNRYGRWIEGRMEP